MRNAQAGGTISGNCTAMRALVTPVCGGMRVGTWRHKLGPACGEPSLEFGKLGTAARARKGIAESLGKIRNVDSER